MKLEIHLVPESAFHNNLRTKIRRDWQQLSRNIRASKNFTCDMCGLRNDRPGSTHLHEVWEYDDDKCIQKLVGFECVCEVCHAVHHWGYSKVSGRDLDRLFHHACRVNGCTINEFHEHIDTSFEVWRERSKKTWTLDTDYYLTLK